MLKPGATSIVDVDFAALACRYTRPVAERATQAIDALPPGRYRVRATMQLGGPDLWPKEGAAALWMGACATAPAAFRILPPVTDGAG